MNTELIDKVVANNVFTEFENVNKSIILTTENMEKLLQRTTALELEFRKMGKSYKDVSSDIEAYNKVEEEVIENTNKLNDLEKQREELIIKEAKAVKERTQVYKNDLSISEQVNNLIKNTLGTREQNALQLIRERNELKLLSQERKNLQKDEKAGIISSEEATIARRDLVLREFELKQAISDLQITLRNEQKILNSSSTSAENHRSTLGRLRTAYRQLNDEQKASAPGQELFSTIQQYRKEVEGTSESLGNFQDSVGNYAKGNRDLGRILSLINPELGNYVSRVQSISTSTEYWVSINQTLIQSFNLSAKAARGLMIGGIGLLIGGVALIINLYRDWRKEQEEIIKQQEEFNRSVAQTASQSISEVNRLSSEWTKLGDNLEAKRKYVEDNRKSFESLGIEINNVNDAETLLVDNKDAFIAAEMAKARATAARTKAAELSAKAIELQIKQEELSADIEANPTVQRVTSYGTAGSAQTIDVVNPAIKELEKVNSEYEKLNQQIMKYYDISYESSQQSINSMQELGLITNEEAQKRKREAEDQLRISKQANDEQLKRMAERSKAIQGIVQQNLQDEIYAQQRIIDNESLTNEERLAALQNLYDKRREILENASDFQIKNEKLTGDQELLVRMTTNASILKLEDDRIKAIQSLETQEFANLKKEAEAYVKSREDMRNQLMQQELTSLNNSYAQEINANIGNAQRINQIQEEFGKDKADIVRKYNLIALEEDIEYLEQQILLFEGNAELQDSIRNQIDITRRKYLQEISEYEVEKANETVDKIISAEERLNEILQDKRTQAILTIWDQALDISNRYYDNQLSRIDELEKREKDSYDQRLNNLQENVEAGLISEEEADAQRRILEATQLEREKEYEAQRREIQLRQARWEKANSIIQTTIATSVAVAQALPNLILAGIVGAMGAAQVALIAAQGIPAYRFGTDYHPGGEAYVGDGGKRELAVLPDGRLWATPSHKTRVNLPEGAKVLPDFNKAIMSMYPVLPYRMDEGKGNQQIIIQDEVVQHNTKELVKGINKMNNGIEYISHSSTRAKLNDKINNNRSYNKFK